MSKQEEIIEVCGKKVVVRYARTQEDACASCAFCYRKECHDLDCNTRDIIGEGVCRYAYFVKAPQETQAAIPDCLIPYCKGCASFLYGECTRPLKEYEPEETHSLQEWAKIIAERPDLRAEFDKMCPPQPIQGSIAPDADVNKWAVTNAFLHCAQAGKIVHEMYGDKFNNSRNRDKYIAFLGQVTLDDRFGELAGILQKYGAMPAPKEQPEEDLEAEIERWWNERYAKMKKDYKFDSMSGHYLNNETIIALARHFAEWGVKRFREQIAEELTKFKWNPTKHLKK